MSFKIPAPVIEDRESSSKMTDFSLKTGECSTKVNTPPIIIREDNSNYESKSNVDDELQQQFKSCDGNRSEKQQLESDEETEYELDDLGNNNDDVPDGWKIVIHNSGMPLYINEELKTCTFTKPYFLGVHSLRKHEIPVANVPCLDYKLRLQKCNAKSEDNPIEHPVTLSHEKYREYCSKLFKFKTFKYTRFRTWQKHNEYRRKLRAEKKLKNNPKLKDQSQ